jgi:hypothetical protein
VPKGTSDHSPKMDIAEGLPEISPLKTLACVIHGDHQAVPVVGV